jgi:hypothetical protein
VRNHWTAEIAQRVANLGRRLQGSCVWLGRAEANAYPTLAHAPERTTATRSAFWSMTRAGRELAVISGPAIDDEEIGDVGSFGGALGSLRTARET